MGSLADIEKTAFVPLLLRAGQLAGRALKSGGKMVGIGGKTPKTAVGKFTKGTATAATGDAALTTALSSGENTATNVQKMLEKKSFLMGGAGSAVKKFSGAGKFNGGFKLNVKDAGTFGKAKKPDTFSMKKDLGNGLGNTTKSALNSPKI